MHQTWKTSSIPQKWERPHQRCKELHPDWSLILWTDEMMLTFVAKEYPNLLLIYSG